MGDSPLSISDTDNVISEESYESENTFWFKTFNSNFPVETDSKPLNLSERLPLFPL